MILPLLLLAAADLPPESQMVMDRARREAAQERKARQERQDSPAATSRTLTAEESRHLQDCIDKGIDNPAEGAAAANAWHLAGGGFLALQCKGFAHARAGEWALSRQSFEQAAAEAQSMRSFGDAARLLAQAGNAALAAGEADKALSLFDGALAQGIADDLAKGEIFLDRARANVALDHLGAARTDLNQALQMAADDPLVWLLSATLARRMDQLDRAYRDILEAVRLSGDDLSVRLEQGKIAILRGEAGEARRVWQDIVDSAPQSDQAAAARDMLSRLPGPSVP